MTSAIPTQPGRTPAGRDTGPHAGPHSDDNAGLRTVRRRLRVVRRAGRTLLAVRAVSLFFSIGLLTTALLVALDYALRLPAGFRFVLLAAVAVSAGVGYVRLIRPVTRYRPPLIDIAARVERWLASRGGAPHARLVGGIGLASGDTDDGLTRALTRLASASVAGLMPGVPWGMIRWRRAALALAALVALAIGSALAINAAPALATTGLARLYAPWTNASWPRLTAIADATPDAVHPSDAPLPLRATLLKSNRAPGEARVTARFRVVGPDGAAGDYTESILVPQPSAEEENTAAGELYERLIEPARWRTPSGSDGGFPAPPGERILEYTIRSEDDATPRHRVRIVDPPRLLEARATVELPAYAETLLDTEGKGETESGTGGETTAPAWLTGERETRTDEASLGPILAGSTITLRLTYSKPITPDPESVPEVVSVQTGIASGDETIVLTLTPDEPAGIELLARGVDGFATREPFRARLAVVPDRPPTATVMKPGGSRAVLPTAVLPIEARGEDDLALETFRVEYQRARPDPDSLSAEPEPLPGPEGEPVVLLSAEAGGASAAPRRVRTLEGSLDIASTGAVPGDEIWITAVATDTYAIDGVRHEPVVSVPRRVRIIEESRFLEMIQDELEGVRRNAINLDERQAGVMDDAEALEADPENADTPEDARTTRDALARRQAEVARRLRVQSDTLEEIRRRLDENRLDDETARELVDSAGRLADAAAREADRAAGQAAERASGSPQSDPSESQQRVRDNLAQMIDRLDRGQDDWVVRRAIERLAEAQRELREQTARAGEQTVGRELDELTPDERTELERIADRQRELAEQAQQAIDDLAQRANEMRESDPTQAAALEQAARDAQRQQLAEAIREAGEQVSQNQTGTATDLQQQSIEDLERMLEGLENAQRLRDQALRRELASLIQSIRSLIRQQSGVIAAIDDDPASASPEAERVRTNTLAAAASGAQMQEVEAIADLLRRAAESQLETVRGLRDNPQRVADARAGATEALARLEEALAEAERQDENAAQRERDRQRRELIDAYRAALETQNALTDRTRVIDPERPTRRDRAELRTIGRDQEALRVEIESIPETHELPEGGITDLYHERIDATLTGIVRRLGRGQTDPTLPAAQARVADLLRTIVEVLSPANDQQDPFDDQQGGGGGGAGGGAGQDQPPIGQLEELRLLRSLQEIVLEETRAAAATSDEPNPDLARTQSRIAEQARRIIESMQQGGPNRPQPGLESPDTENGTEDNPPGSGSPEDGPTEDGPATGSPPPGDTSDGDTTDDQPSQEGDK